MAKFSQQILLYLFIKLTKFWIQNRQAAIEESILTLKRHRQFVENIASIKPKDTSDYESDISSVHSNSLQGSSFSAQSKNSLLASEFASEPLAVWAIQHLHEDIIGIPQALTGYEQLNRSITRIKENIRAKAWGQKIILAWDERTTSLATMTLKDYLRAINDCFFVNFPSLAQTTTLLLTQWNNQKSALKLVLDTQVVTCSTFTIKKILDNKRFELERKGQVHLEGLSSKTRSFVLKALQDSGNSKKF